jgi:hypothetical protein
MTALFPLVEYALKVSMAVKVIAKTTIIVIAMIQVSMTPEMLAVV